MLAKEAIRAPAMEAAATTVDGDPAVVATGSTAAKETMTATN